MGLRLVTDVPRRFRARFLLRGLVVLVAVLLLALALLAGAVALVLLALYVTSPDVFPAAIALSTAGLISMMLGLRLLRGRRRLVLFLRRFRLTEATEAVTVALATAMGRSWRVVTLDDTQTPPIGVPPSIRRSLAVTTGIGAAAVTGALIWFPPADMLALFSMAGELSGLLDGMLSVTSHDVLTPKEGGAGVNDLPAALFATLIGLPILAAAVVVVVVLTMVVFLVVTAFVGFFGLMMASGYVRARRAESRKRATVESLAEIETIARDLPRRSRRIMGPRLTVLTVASPIWRDAVRVLVVAAPVVLIDVSQPSQNLLWEVETLRRDPSARWVLIGDHARLDGLAASQHGPGATDPVVQRLAVLLDGESVLAYRAGRRSMRRFARALRASLDAAV